MNSLTTISTTVKENKIIVEIIPHSTAFLAITDDQIKGASTTEIDDLYRRLSKELCSRREQPKTVILNSWLHQQKQRRNVKYCCIRDVDGWIGVLTVHDENGNTFAVTDGITIASNAPPSNYKSQLREKLALKMVTRLGI
jgi:hypothetical protein